MARPHTQGSGRVDLKSRLRQEKNIPSITRHYDERNLPLALTLSREAFPKRLEQSEK